MAGIVIAAVVALVVGFGVGLAINRARQKSQKDQSRDQAESIMNAARTEAETIKRDAAIEAKELVFRARSDIERETKERRTEVLRKEDALAKREENADRKTSALTAKEDELGHKEKSLSGREQAAEAAARKADELVGEAKQRLERLAGMSAEQARQKLVEQVTEEAKKAAAVEIKKIEDATREEAELRAKKIIGTAVQRYAGEYVAERTVAVVPLPNDDMKGRIIGREGRNIRALEAATGIDLIIDDTPEAVIISCFNPVRREIARLALTRLIADGRIHPTRIEEVVAKCTEEVEQQCKEAGEQAVFDLGLNRVHPELVKLLGRLKYRSSYAQNLLLHSIEVGFLAGVMASELGVNVKLARRAGLLHDIGKAIDHEIEGPHAVVGAGVAKKYGEAPKVVEAIGAHHADEPQQTVLDHIVDAANRLSSQRPGARRELLQSYVTRLNDLEKICLSYTGVERAYAIQAGREVRVLVENSQVNDDQAVVLSKDIAHRVETELSYPGQIRIAVIRETRAVDYAK
ncbi:MAG TPA: ribonuclease Y [Polyangia bacterium]|jgi:ribonuclease Y